MTKIVDLNCKTSFDVKFKFVERLLLPKSVQITPIVNQSVPPSLSQTADKFVRVTNGQTYIAQKLNALKENDLRN